MDFDLEAPGLHYKFQPFVKTSDIKKGLVDYIYEFTHNKVILQSLDEFKLEISIPEYSGNIQMIPAGNFLSSDYWQKLASIDWHDLFYKEGSEGIPFFLELKEKIEAELKPDFLLIDSRTGVTEMSGLCTSLLPDKVVFLIANNRENVEGARQILRSIQKAERLPGQKPIKIDFALTRIPFSDEIEAGIETTIIRNIKDFLNEPVEYLGDQLNIEDISILHSDRELELWESLKVVVPKEAPLLSDYLRLFAKIIPDSVILPNLEKLQDMSGKADILMALGDQSMRTADLKEAKERYSDALSIFQKIDEKLGVANTQMALGDLSMRTADLKEAKDRYSDALSIFQKIDAKLGVANTFMRVGQMSIISDDLKKGEVYLDQAFSIFNEIDELEGKADVHMCKALFYIKNNKVEKARSELNECFSIRKKVLGHGEAAQWLILYAEHLRSKHIDEGVELCLNYARKFSAMA